MRKDLDLYIIDLQNQVDKMNASLEKVNKELSEGLATQEQADVLIDYYGKVVENLNRLLYCRHLLDLPPKFIQKWQERKIQKAQDEFFKKMADKESVMKENDEYIEKVDEMVEEIKNGSDNQ